MLKANVTTTVTCKSVSFYYRAPKSPAVWNLSSCLLDIKTCPYMVASLLFISPEIKTGSHELQTRFHKLKVVHARFWLFIRGSNLSNKNLFHPAGLLELCTLLVVHLGKWYKTDYGKAKIGPKEPDYRCENHAQLSGALKLRGRIDSEHVDRNCRTWTILEILRH